MGLSHNRHDIKAKTEIEKHTLRFTYSRLNSLLRTLQIVNLDEYTPLQRARLSQNDALETPQIETLN